MKRLHRSQQWLILLVIPGIACVLALNAIAFMQARAMTHFVASGEQE